MEPCGILLVDKPSGMTSHDIVNVLRRKLGIKKIGHAGTLDPAASGLMLMLIGKGATKRAMDYSGMDKFYEARLTLGTRTDSADHTGTVTARSAVRDFSPEEIRGVLEKFRGQSTQVPPMVCAKKIGGEKLYKLARKGIIVDRVPQKINIAEIKLKEISLPDICFDVRCSKGTYVRTLCEDIAAALGTLGHMSGLRRTEIGNFQISAALSVERIKQLSAAEIAGHIMDI